MKTKLFFLVLLIGCFSCDKNEKQVSEAQKEGIKGEVKEVFNSIMKGAEAANFDLVVGHWLNSPDFLFVYNGNIFDYNQATEMGKSALGSLNNQKATVVDERFAVLDHSTVLYTVNMKCTMNFREKNF